MITYFQAIILGLVQGVTELFPVSSLGHSIIIANLFGWNTLVKQETAKESGLLAFLVILHLATAIALLIFYWAEWKRIIAGFFRSLKTQKITGDSDAKLAWLLIAATIPAGLFGLVFEHPLRIVFAKPIFAILFLIINGIILIKGDKIVRAAQLHRPRQRRTAAESGKIELADVAKDELSVEKSAKMVSDQLSLTRAISIGVIQIGAFFAGISRSGITMIAGLRSGLNHQDAARFSFLLATPIIFAAGLYKLHDFVGANGNGIRGQVLAGGLVAGVAAYISVRYLDKYFRNRSLRPFGIYCISLGTFVFLFDFIFHRF